MTSQGYVINNICLKKILKILEKRFGRSNVFIIWYVEILHHHLIRGNTSDFIDHPLPKHFVSAPGASHHAWAPGPHHLNLALGARKMCGWTAWHTPRFARSNLAKPNSWHCAYVRKKTFDFLLCRLLKSSKFLVFLFPCWDITKCLNASISTTAVFEPVQQFYHATEIGNVANAVSTALALLSHSRKNKDNCFS